LNKIREKYFSGLEGKTGEKNDEDYTEDILLFEVWLRFQKKNPVL
jgi:hypothetical protein